MNEMKVKGIARRNRDARAEREEPDSGNEKGKECEKTIHGKWLDGKDAKLMEMKGR